MVDLVTRIPAKDIPSCQGWIMPDVSSGKVIPAIKAAKKNTSNPHHSTAKKNKLNSDDKESPSLAGGKNFAEKNSVDNNNLSKETVTESIETIEVDSDTIQPITAEQLDEISQQAEKEGYDIGFEKGIEEGKKKGYEQGLAEGKKAINEQADRLKYISEALLTPLENEQKIIQEQLVNYVCELTKAIVQRELMTDSSMIVAVVEKAMNLLPANEQALQLYMNSQDIDLVKQSLSDLPETLNYQIDDNLLPGGCRLENKNSRIDLSVERRLEKILDDFIKQRYGEPPEEEEPAKESREQPNGTHGNSEKPTQPTNDSFSEPDTHIDDVAGNTLNQSVSQQTESKEPSTPNSIE